MGKHRQKAVPIVKASGEIEPFFERKLRRSLRRSGAGPAVVDSVVKTIQKQLRPGITSNALFRIAHRELKRAARPSAVRYSLKRSVMALGPSGFAFENLVAALFAADGYRTDVGVKMRGKCVVHEVDVVADRGVERHLVECKFRNQPGYRTDVKVALYVSARATDLKSAPAGDHDAFWLVTNAKFTSDAVRYGECAGLRLLAWDYPKNAGIERQLDAANLVLVTALTTLTNREKERLLANRVVLARELSRRELSKVGASPATMDRVQAELDRLHDT